MDLRFFTQEVTLTFLALHGLTVAVTYLLFRLGRRVRRGWPLEMLLYLVFFGGLLAFTIPHYHPVLAEHYFEEGDYIRASRHFARARELASRQGLGGRAYRWFLGGGQGEAALASGLAVSWCRAGQVNQGIRQFQENMGQWADKSTVGLNAFLMALCLAESSRTKEALDILVFSMIVDGDNAARASRQPLLAPMLAEIMGKEM